MHISNITPADLTSVLSATPSGSFLRLGDGELRFLLEIQNSEWQDGRYDQYQRRPSPDEATGTLGLMRKDYDRLLAAYEGCTVLDIYGGLPYNRSNISQVRISRPRSSITVSSSPNSPLLNAWTCQEFRSYTIGRRVVICGAEASLQQALLNRPDYLERAREYWPEGAKVWLVQPPGNGQNLSENLDLTKQILLEWIWKTRSDTVLLSLGGAAKILCFEIAKEANVSAIDWGSMLRAFTYSGSDGYANWRSSHNPFLFRVPLCTYFSALLESYPSMPTEWYIGKVHCQLILNLHVHDVTRTHAADVHDTGSRDFSESNVHDFLEDYRYYLREIVPKAFASRRLISEFHYGLIRNRVPIDIGAKWRIGYHVDRVFKKLGAVFTVAPQ